MRVLGGSRGPRAVRLLGPPSPGGQREEATLDLASRTVGDAIEEGRRLWRLPEGPYEIWALTGQDRLIPLARSDDVGELRDCRELRMYASGYVEAEVAERGVVLIREAWPREQALREWMAGLGHDRLCRIGRSSGVLEEETVWTYRADDKALLNWTDTPDDAHLPPEIRLTLGSVVRLTIRHAGTAEEGQLDVPTWRSLRENLPELCRAVQISVPVGSGLEIGAAARRAGAEPTSMGPEQRFEGMRNDDVIELYRTGSLRMEGRAVVDASVDHPVGVQLSPDGRMGLRTAGGGRIAPDETIAGSPDVLGEMIRGRGVLDIYEEPYTAILVRSASRRSVCYARSRADITDALLGEWAARLGDEAGPGGVWALCRETPEGVLATFSAPIAPGKLVDGTEFTLCRAYTVTARYGGQSLTMELPADVPSGRLVMAVALRMAPAPSQTGQLALYVEREDGRRTRIQADTTLRDAAFRPGDAVVLDVAEEVALQFLVGAARVSVTVVRSRTLRDAASEALRIVIGDAVIGPDGTVTAAGLRAAVYDAVTGQEMPLDTPVTAAPTEALRLRVWVWAHVLALVGGEMRCLSGRLPAEDTIERVSATLATRLGLSPSDGYGLANLTSIRDQFFTPGTPAWLAPDDRLAMPARCLNGLAILVLARTDALTPDQWPVSEAPPADGAADVDVTEL